LSQVTGPKRENSRGLHARKEKGGWGKKREKKVTGTNKLKPGKKKTTGRPKGKEWGKKNLWGKLKEIILLLRGGKKG